MTVPYERFYPNKFLIPRTTLNVAVSGSRLRWRICFALEL
jgi:hypothetical protein